MNNGSERMPERPLTSQTHHGEPSEDFDPPTMALDALPEDSPTIKNSSSRRQGKRATQEDTVAALKEQLNNDFIYFVARVNQQSKMVCTCGKFEEYAENSASGENRLAKTALRHCRKTGHALNPRGT